jgi:hypothetical protein
LSYAHSLLLCDLFTDVSQGLSYSAIIIRVGLGIAERGSGGSSPLPIARFSAAPSQPTSRSREHMHANALAISVDKEVSVCRDGGRSGGGRHAADDPEIALELVDELGTHNHGDKPGRPSEALSWHTKTS